jgi:hypothetical protein
MESIKSKYNLQDVFKIGEGEKAEFYIAVSVYKDKRTLLFLNVNKTSKWVGGLYAMPIELLDQLIERLQVIKSKVGGGNVQE